MKEHSNPRLSDRDGRASLLEQRTSLERSGSVRTHPLSVAAAAAVSSSSSSSTHYDPFTSRDEEDDAADAGAEKDDCGAEGKRRVSASASAVAAGSVKVGDENDDNVEHRRLERG